MQTPADRVVAGILQADDRFLIEIGRLTLLFSRIEDCLVNDARQLAPLSEDETLKAEAVAPAVSQLRVLEKRDLLKRIYADIARYYNLDNRRLDRVLDELGNINRLRRSIVHGWLRWSEAEQRPVFADSRGQTVPAWPNDIMDLNMSVLRWYQSYYEEQHAIMAAVMDAYNAFAHRLTRHPSLPHGAKQLIAHFKARLDKTQGL